VKWRIRRAVSASVLVSTILQRVCVCSQESDCCRMATVWGKLSPSSSICPSRMKISVFPGVFFRRSDAKPCRFFSAFLRRKTATLSRNSTYPYVGISAASDAGEEFWDDSTTIRRQTMLSEQKHTILKTWPLWKREEHQPLRQLKGVKVYSEAMGFSQDSHQFHAIALFRHLVVKDD